MNRIKTRRITANEKKNLAIRWILYVLIILLCFITASSGNFRKPLLLIPVSLCIASYAREHTALIIGIVCGLLLDITCGKLIGFNAILLCFMCIGISILYKHFLMHRLFSFLILAAAGIFIQGMLDFFFYYVMWNYENVGFLFKNHILPCCIYTLISALPVYAVIHNINRLLRPNTIRTIEEAVIDNENQ